jgi:hypothetical protein
MVIVESKTDYNNTVGVVFDEVEVIMGGKKEKRELSRLYTFDNFKTEMPIKHAKILVKKYPDNYSIINDDTEPCPYCKFESSSQQGLLVHINKKHPEEYLEWKKENYNAN